MQRRTFIAGVAASASAGWINRVSEQPARPRPLVAAMVYSTPDREPNAQVFLQRMQQLGYVPGQNIAIEFHGAEGKPERFAEMAKHVVSQQPNVIVVLGGDVVPAVAKATQ